MRLTKQELNKIKVARLHLYSLENRASKIEEMAEIIKLRSQDTMKILDDLIDKKKRIDCRCACHKTKNKDKGTCEKCYMIQCDWWKDRNFAYATCEGLWVGKKERTG